MDAWPKSVYGFPVIKEPIGSGVALSHPIVGVLHTVEAMTDEAAATVFHGNPAEASHFSCDGDSIRQFRSLSETSGSLRHDPGANTYKGETNSYAVQIEIADRSRTSPWSPIAATLDRVAALVAYISDYHSIPLVVPNDWPDDCHDMPLPWSAKNSRRVWAEQSNRWPNVRGWWEHMEVPGQGPTWHWDCGAMRRTVILEKAAVLLGLSTGGGDDLVTTKDQNESLAYLNGAKEAVMGHARPKDGEAAFNGGDKGDYSGAAQAGWDDKMAEIAARP